MWYIFDGFSSQWPCMGRELMTLDCFRESIMRLDAALRPYDVQLYDLLMNSKDDIFSANDVVNSIPGITAIQVKQHDACQRFSRNMRTNIQRS